MRVEGRYAAANVGFIVYDRGIPVNDFRYLSRVETLDLDWEDPWYSRFRNRNLVRQYDAPLSVFLYVEHFEVRQEVCAAAARSAAVGRLGAGRQDNASGL